MYNVRFAYLKLTQICFESLSAHQICGVSTAVYIDLNCSSRLGPKPGRRFFILNPFPQKDPTERPMRAITTTEQAGGTA